jgi:peptidoglycan/LPS O-acetylase OafA/YrhL
MTNLFKIDIDTNRIYGLDILRALAIMFVVIGHGSCLLPQKMRVVSDFLTFDGVSIFFVLSGFLIGGILIKLIDEKGINFHILKQFWIRRWFRTLPSYFLVLILLFIVHFTFDDTFNPSSVLSYFVFSQNIFTEHPTWFFPEAWSLCVEEWFYIVLPVLLFVIFLFSKSLKTNLFYIALLAIVFVTAYRGYRFSNTVVQDAANWDLLFRKQVVTRLDSLMFGVVGAYISYFQNDLWLKFKNQLLFLGLLLLIASKWIMPYMTSIDSAYSCVFSFTLISIGTLFLLPFLSQLKTGKGQLYKLFTCISLMSYSMYLLNLSVVQRWIINNIPWEEITDNRSIKGVSNYGVYWLLVIGFSILLYKYFELPTTSLRERFK